MPSAKKRHKKKKSWRKAVQKAMRQATEEEASRRYGTDEPVFNYRWEHVKAVVTLALRLADLTSADREVIEAAAWLHDVCKGEGENHPEAGARFARRFLPQTDFPTEKIERVARAIERHIGLWRDKPLKDLEAQVLWDADKLAKIGLTAAFHFSGGTLAKGKPQTTRDLIANGRDADWQEKTVASMHTEPAHRAAQKRLQAYNNLWSTLEAELNGDDLTGS